jgi:hypothetical protein
MSDPSRRVELTREAGVLRIGIPVPRSPGIALFLTAWLAAWALAAKMIAGELLAAHAPLPVRAFLAAWLAVWALAGLFILWAILWSLAGREELALDSRTLTIRHSVAGLGRSRAFALDAIESIERVPARSGPVEGVDDGARPAKGGSIRFRHGRRTYRIGNGLGGAELERVFAELRSRLPPRARGER